jgi:hypothetical protein
MVRYLKVNDLILYLGTRSEITDLDPFYTSSIGLSQIANKFNKIEENSLILDFFNAKEQCSSFTKFTRIDFLQDFAQILFRILF